MRVATCYNLGISLAIPQLIQAKCEKQRAEKSYKVL